MAHLATGDELGNPLATRCLLIIPNRERQARPNQTLTLTLSSGQTHVFFQPQRFFSLKTGFVELKKFGVQCGPLA